MGTWYHCKLHNTCCQLLSSHSDHGKQNLCQPSYTSLSSHQLYQIPTRGDKKNIRRTYQFAKTDMIKRSVWEYLLSWSLPWMITKNLLKKTIRWSDLWKKEKNYGSKSKSRKRPCFMDLFAIISRANPLNASYLGCI